MKSIHKFRLLYSLATIALFSLGACSKMDDLHDPYLKRGETIYVGKPDSLKIFAGKDRVKLRYWISDPKSAKMTVYWLSRRDSVVIDIPPHSAKDSLEYIISNLPEYTHSFEFVTSNKNFENKSVTFQAPGTAYGDNFQSSLSNRIIQSTFLPSATELKINWLGSVEKGIGSEVVYFNSNGVSMKRYVPMIDSETLIEDVDVTKGVTTRTLFLPEPTAIDTFYTAYKEIEIEKIVAMDKSLFAKWNPPGIPLKQYAAAYGLDKLWDNSAATRYLVILSAFPLSQTFDLGQTSIITRINARMTSGQLFSGQSIKDFEIWGSPTPNVSDDFSVGWVKLGSYTFSKVGSPGEDTVKGLAGEDFPVDANAPAVRYIRFVINSTWGGGKAATLDELTFLKPL